MATILLGLSFSLLHSANFSYERLWDLLPGYTALALEAFTSSILEHTQGVLIPTLGSSFASGISIIGGFVFHAMLYLLSKIFVSISYDIDRHLK